MENARRLLDASQGLAKLVTLAPEHDAGFATTAWLTLQAYASPRAIATPPMKSCVSPRTTGSRCSPTWQRLPHAHAPA
ncbi:hypothetical protein [Verrucomicrobium spinosum]|uniref:hypothetical protein n=1 Tax=Verrucomicrobium spinosum TaxID=2736 RepID=UPI001C445E29|nr:hypothetical protein [Verrucomicrobium spinosum]